MKNPLQPLQHRLSLDTQLVNEVATILSSYYYFKRHTDIYCVEALTLESCCHLDTKTTEYYVPKQIFILLKKLYTYEIKKNIYKLILSKLIKLMLSLSTNCPVVRLLRRNSNPTLVKL